MREEIGYDYGKNSSGHVSRTEHIYTQQLNVDEYALTLGGLTKIASDPDAEERQRNNAMSAIEKISVNNPEAHQAFMARTGTEE